MFDWATNTVLTSGDGGGVDSEEGLDSHTGTKALVPQLTPSKTDAKDHHPADKQHPTKVWDHA